MTPNQFRNLLAFTALVTGEEPAVLNYAPDYIIEKYMRYMGAPPPDDNRWNWGHHPILRNHIDAYCQKWGIDTEAEVVKTL
jgi:hypothetical protein